MAQHCGTGARAVPPGRRADRGRCLRGRAGGRHREHDAQSRPRPPHGLQARFSGRLQATMWEALTDPAAGINIDPDRREPGQAIRHQPRGRRPVRQRIVRRAVAAQESDFLAGEIVPVVREVRARGATAARHQAAGQADRGRDRHLPSLSPAEVLARLRPVYEGGVQTGGNSSALRRGSGLHRDRAPMPRAWQVSRWRAVAAAVVGVPPEIMGTAWRR